MMPVQKFRTLEEWQESKRAFWLDCHDPTLADRVRSHWKMWSKLVPYASPRGLRKYNSTAEADADRDQWERERIERIRAERLRK
jgi:hypothetical protein